MATKYIAPVMPSAPASATSAAARANRWSLPRRAVMSRIDARKHLESAAGIVGFMHHGDGQKVGLCQMKRIAKRAAASTEIELVIAVQPITGGIAPGMAPIMVLSEVHRFIGV